MPEARCLREVKEIEPHRIRAVSCASCHVAPGAHAKLNGTRQLFEVAFNTYPRPVEGALESNKLVSSVETCEQCHARERYIGSRLVIHSEFGDDETNTPVVSMSALARVDEGRTFAKGGWQRCT